MNLVLFFLILFLYIHLASYLEHANRKSIIKILFKYFVIVLLLNICILVPHSACYTLHSMLNLLMYHIRLLIVSNHAVRMYSKTHSNRNRGFHTSNKLNINQIAKDLHLYQTIFNPFNLFKLRIMKLSLSKKN